ncbi:adipokinetic hormone/corazonin-related peptide receptor variant I-like [Ischnura elegans]|uniref:adipokinetic hormone/corazonin-related peptide receptor variant I-like n=1 Tax=Ischnura elegans TaxID=197161 RepID=UPI001ED8ABB3|nr:adipokinetic hormone/corazonin-related peptide receptor variant I-like [Ischnura elegans]
MESISTTFLPTTVTWLNMSSGNATVQDNYTDEVPKQEELPEDMRYNAGHTVSIVTYSILLVVSAVGNISVLCILLRRRRGARSRINTMLLHLAIADLLVTFILMPLEIAWAATVSWRAGDAACRIMAFFRTFGLFLSGFVLACISIDRYFAVLKPLMLTNVDRRGKVMLSIAWMASVACSLPQVAIFHVERHPNFTWFEQCVTFNSFPSNEYELTYSLFGMVMMYGLPLVIITFSYISILAEIFRRSRDSGSGE